MAHTMDFFGGCKSVTRFSVEPDDRLHEATGFPLTLHKSFFRSFKIMRRVDGHKWAILFGEEQETSKVGYVVVPKTPDASRELSDFFQLSTEIYAASIFGRDVVVICSE